MNRLTKVATTVVIGATLVLASGGTALATTAEPTSPSTTYVTPKTISAQQVKSYTIGENGQRTMTLAVSPGSIVVGDTLVVTPPSGANLTAGSTSPKLVAKVTATRAAGSDTTVDVQTVSALYALAPGQHSVTGTGSGATMVMADGTRVPASATASHTFNASFDKTITCDNGSINVTGSLALTPRITVDANVDWHWDGPELVSAKVEGGIDEDVNLTLKMNGTSADISCVKTLPLATVSFPVAIGPVEATVRMALTADGTATLSGASAYTVNQHFGGTAGVSYDKTNGWNAYHSTTKTITHNLGDARSATVEGGLSANASVSFYDVLTAGLNLRGYAGMAIARTTDHSTPPWELYAGVSLTGYFKVLSYTVKDFTIWAERWSLVSSPDIAADSLPTAHQGYAYYAQVPAKFGAAPYTFTASGLPSGLSLTSDGQIRGTVPSGTANQTAWVAVTVRDAKGYASSRTLPLPVQPLVILTTSIGANVGNAYSALLKASGNQGTMTWSASGLPAGLRVSSAGWITGTPEAQGTGTATVRVTDQSGLTVTKSIPWTVGAHTTCTYKYCDV